MDGGVLVWDGTGRDEPAAKCTAGTGIPATDAPRQPDRRTTSESRPRPDPPCSGPPPIERASSRPSAPQPCPAPLPARGSTPETEGGAKPPHPHNEGALGDTPVTLGTRFGPIGNALGHSGPNVAMDRRVGPPPREPRGCIERRPVSQRPSNGRRRRACPLVPRRPPRPGRRDPRISPPQIAGTDRALPNRRARGRRNRTWPRPRGPPPEPGRPYLNRRRVPAAAIPHRRLRTSGLRWREGGGDAWPRGRY